MASAWRIAGMGWGVTVLGWLLSPIIGLLLNKILSYLGFDASQKLRDLEIHTIPELKRALREVEEQRMLRAARKEISNVDILDKLATMLRSVLYEAEDILDLIDYHQIEKKVIGDGKSHDNSWPQRWAQQSLCWLGRCVRAALHRSAALLPISCPPSVSLSSVQRIRCWSGSFDFNNSCRSIFVWSANAIEVARSYRNWSYHEVGITSYQEDGIAVDSFLPTIARWNLKKRIEKLENTVTGVQKSHLLNQERGSAPNDIANMNRRSIRSIAARKVFGRDKERNMITNMLREGPADEYAPSSSSSKCYSAIGIYGIAGSGKTTLAEYVCDYEKEAKYFSPIMCIHVSETFRVEDIFHDMLEEITNNRHSNITDPKVLKARLQEQLRDRRFLLVLDDLHDVKNRQELEELLCPLNVGRRGSKILVTSRRKDAPLVAKRPILISDLSEEQYFSMFMHYALDDTSVDDREYIKIGREIVKNLHKSPIAAVTVAGQLWRNPDLGFWGTVANLDLSNQTMGALWWSYQQLDVDVRRCFEYCSIFPRRYELERDKLVHMWIAQGFVKATKASEDIEDVGKSYFRQLQACSFLQLKRKTNSNVISINALFLNFPKKKRKTSSDIGSGEYFTVHDLLHDLAERVAGSDCFKIERGIVGQISHDVRHLCIESYGETVLPEQIFELKNLRTLIMRCFVMEMSKEDFERVFMSLRKLRVVHLELQRLETIPGCIGQLKHLRYLGIFAHGPINSLPAEFTKLYHLQVLSVPPYTHLHFSSEEKMSNLINLRYMHTWCGLNFPDVGRLTSLQNLYSFHVRNKRGYEIQQLEHLNKLRGTLYIEGLKYVKSKEEALQAKLARKKHLTELTLRWGGVDHQSCHQSCSPELQAEVLEGLHPPSQITSLSIVEYGGLRYPSWLSGDRVTQQDSRNDPALQTLRFWSCNGSGVPPRIGGFFVHLCTLLISDCSWNSLPANMDRLTSLEELNIQECPNIQSLPKLPQSLKKFMLFDSNRSLTESCMMIGHPNWQKIRHIDEKIFWPRMQDSCGNLAGVETGEAGEAAITEQVCKNPNSPVLELNREIIVSGRMARQEEHETVQESYEQESRISDKDSDEEHATLQKQHEIMELDVDSNTNKQADSRVSMLLSESSSHLVNPVGREPAGMVESDPLSRSSVAASSKEDGSGDSSTTARDLRFELLEKITGGFSKEREIGSGGYGKVYKGVLNGKEIAVKKLHSHLVLDDVIFKNEFENLMRVRHQNIVELVGYCYEIRYRYVEHDGRNVYAEMADRVLCFEYLQNGSLDKHLYEEHRGLDWCTRYKIIKGICEGLNYLHGLEESILHLDLKPANILLDENMVPKIADFGLSRLFGGTHTHITKNLAGTQMYMPPEYVKGCIITKKYDVFSLGVIIIQIMTGRDGFSKYWEMSSQQFIELATSMHTSAGEDCKQVKRCIEIALNCVEIEREKRPTIGDIIHKLRETETTTHEVPMLFSQESGNASSSHFKIEMVQNWSQEKQRGGPSERLFKSITRSPTKNKVE